MKKLGFYLGLIINALYLTLNFYILLSYLKSHTVSEAYSYRYVLMYYLSFLFVISCIVIAIYRVIQWPNLLFKGLALMLFIFNIGSSFYIDYFLQTDVNKVRIIIRNMAIEPLSNIKIIARNHQDLHVGYLLPGQVKEVFCDCRDVPVENKETIGLELRFQYNYQEKEVICNLLGPYSNIFDEYMELRVINDTLLHKRSEYGNEIVWEEVTF